MAENARAAEHPIEPVFLARWSPRSLTGEPIASSVLMRLFEAARWAPSAFNLQPWRFVYAHAGGPGWQDLFDLLIPYNQTWVANASALIFVASALHRRRADGASEPIYSHSFDAGAAWGYLALQAHQLGWVAHGMTGFDHRRCYEVLGAPEAEYRIEAAIAVGRTADPGQLPDHLQARERPSARELISSFVFEARFPP